MPPGEPCADHALFTDYFTAYRTQCWRGLDFHYALLPNCVIVPEEADFASVVFQYVHEETHAQLANTPLGLTLQTIAKMAGQVQEAVFVQLRPVLNTIRDTGGTELYRELFLFGRKGNAEEVPLFAAGVREEYERLCRDPTFSADKGLFELLTNRHDRLFSRWRPVHEGLCILNSIAVARSETAESREFLERAASAASLIARSPGDLRAITEDLAVCAQREEERWGDLPAGPTSAAGASAGFVVLRDALERTGELTHVWLLALFASHFPYHRVDLLDMSDEAFERHVTCGTLSPWVRLGRLLPHLPAVAGTLHHPERGRALLEAIDSEYKGEPLSPEAVYFGSWERDYLWGSTCFERFLGKPLREALSADVLAVLDEFQEDRRFDVRMWARNEPVLVLSDGTIVTEAGRKQAFMSNFIHWYEVYRTATLLRTIENGTRAG